MLKKKFLFLLMVVTFIILIGLISKSFADEKPKVVVVLQDLNSQYWNIVKAGAEKGFQDFRIDGKVIAPSHQSEKDVLESVLENVLKERPDVLVVSPTESPKVISILEKFVENKIPVILLDADIPLENKISYIGTNNFDLGRMAGVLLGSHLQPGDEVALITAGPLSSVILGERIKGAKISLEAVGIKIVEEKAELPNEHLPAKKAMTTILQNYPNVKGVFATTDIIALGALEAIEEQGYKMPVIGADGSTEVIKLIEEGSLTSTIAQNPYDMGYLGSQTSMKLVKGDEVDRTIDTGVDIIIKGNGKERLDFLTNSLK